MHPATSPLQVGPVRAWIVNHDESRLFVLLYTVLALVLSIGIGLFWLVALVLVHFAFEYVRFRHERLRPASAAASALWALRLDLALVLFAVVLTLYLKLVLGVLGLQAASRAGAAAQAGLRGGTRFAAWEKVLRGVLLSADDAVRSVRAVTLLRGQSTARVAAPAAAAVAVASPAGAGRRWGAGDLLVAALAGGCLLLIAAAPWAGHGSLQAVLGTLAAELHPFPSR